MDRGLTDLEEELERLRDEANDDHYGGHARASKEDAARLLSGKE